MEVFLTERKIEHICVYFVLREWCYLFFFRKFKNQTKYEKSPIIIAWIYRVEYFMKRFGGGLLCWWALKLGTERRAVSSRIRISWTVFFNLPLMCFSIDLARVHRSSITPNSAPTYSPANWSSSAEELVWEFHFIRFQDRKFRRSLSCFIWPGIGIIMGNGVLHSRFFFVAIVVWWLFWVLKENSSLWIVRLILPLLDLVAGDLSDKSLVSLLAWTFEFPSFLEICCFGSSSGSSMLFLFGDRTSTSDRTGMISSITKLCFLSDMYSRADATWSNESGKCSVA